MIISGYSSLHLFLSIIIFIFIIFFDEKHPTMLFFYVDRQLRIITDKSDENYTFAILRVAFFFARINNPGLSPNFYFQIGFFCVGVLCDD